MFNSQLLAEWSYFKHLICYRYSFALASLENNYKLHNSIFQMDYSITRQKDCLNYFHCFKARLIQSD